MSDCSKTPILLLFVLALGLCIACGGGAGSTPVEVTVGQAEAEDAAVVEAGPTVVEPPVAEPAQSRPEKTTKVVVLDPGHGGDEVGAAHNGVVEKASNLDMALRVEKLLQAQGVEVVLTRRTDSRAWPQVAGFTAARSDIQARIDLANEVAADAFVSIHSNGSTDVSQKGVEAWYDSNRPFADENVRLARLLLRHVLVELRGYGYPAVDRGLFDGKCFRLREGRCFTLFVLGGPRETSRADVMRRGGDPEALGFNGGPVIYSRAAAMPGALIELLIISNPADADALKQEGSRNAMAQGVARAVMEFLGLTYEPS